MISKQQLRQKAKKQRAAMSTKQVAGLSQKICDRLEAFDLFAQCRSIFIYVSFGKEVSTHDLIGSLLHQDKIVAVPKMVDEKRITPVQIGDWKDLVSSDHGILAPAEGSPCQSPLGVCVTPGIAFSEQGHRLGYGAGCYDRWLGRHPGLLTIGLAFEQQMFSEVPTESFDRTMDVIVTEQRTLLTGRKNG